MERRGAPRAEFNGITIVRQGANEHPCLAANLSETGILLYPQGASKSGRAPRPPLQVTFALPQLQDWIRLGGIVVREDRHNLRPVWGVKFEAVPPPIRELLRSYVRHEAHQDPKPVERVELRPRPTRLTPLPTAQARPRDARTTAPLRPAGRAPTQALPRPEQTRRMPRQQMETLQATEEPTRQTPIPEIIAGSGKEETRAVEGDVLSLLSDLCRKD